MKAKIIHGLSATVKVTTIVTGLAAYAHVIPEAWMGIAVLVFASASAAKEVALIVGDIADDGQRNGSFKV